MLLDENEDTVWATEQQIMQLFGEARRTIGEHIINFFSRKGLNGKATWREFRQVQKEGQREVETNIQYD